MKKLSVIWATALFMFLAIGINDAQAQQRATVGQLVAGLVNVNIGAVQADVEVDNVLNNFTLVDASNVLRNADIRILNNAINNNEIASRNRDILTNLLREAEILTQNQVVVGVLSGGIIVFR